jgi:hypothetical protein
MKSLLEVLAIAVLLAGFATVVVLMREQVLFMRAWRRDMSQSVGVSGAWPFVLWTRNLSAEGRIRRRRIYLGSVLFFALMALMALTLFGIRNL